MSQDGINHLVGAIKEQMDIARGATNKLKAAKAAFNAVSKATKMEKEIKALAEALGVAVNTRSHRPEEGLTAIAEAGEKAGLDVAELKLLIPDVKAISDAVALANTKNPVKALEIARDYLLSKKPPQA